VIVPGCEAELPQRGPVQPNCDARWGCPGRAAASRGTAGGLSRRSSRPASRVRPVLPIQTPVDSQFFVRPDSASDCPYLGSWRRPLESSGHASSGISSCKQQSEFRNPEQRREPREDRQAMALGFFYRAWNLVGLDVGDSVASSDGVKDFVHRPSKGTQEGDWNVENRQGRFCRCSNY